jgi:hypothetical protein
MPGTEMKKDAVFAARETGFVVQLICASVTNHYNSDGLSSCVQLCIAKEIIWNFLKFSTEKAMFELRSGFLFSFKSIRSKKIETCTWLIDFVSCIFYSALYHYWFKHRDKF